MDKIIFYNKFKILFNKFCYCMDEKTLLVIMLTVFKTSEFKSEIQKKER